MNKAWLKFAALAGLGAMAALPGAAQAATVSGNSTANVAVPVTIVKNNDLRFGTIMRPATGSTAVWVNSGETATIVCGGLVCSGTSGAAKFTISGNANALISISVTATTTMTSPSSTQNLVVTLAPNVNSTYLDATGNAVIYVGGTMTVSNTMSGSYSGTFNLTSDYQ